MENRDVAAARYKSCGLMGQDLGSWHCGSTADDAAAGPPAEFDGASSFPVLPSLESTAMALQDARVHTAWKVGHQKELPTDVVSLLFKLAKGQDGAHELVERLGHLDSSEKYEKLCSDFHDKMDDLTDDFVYHFFCCGRDLSISRGFETDK
jgi:hypothetical protein